MRRAALLIFAALITLAAPARATDLVPADPWQIIHVAREFGPAEVARDGMNDPQIRGTIDGLHYRLDFYGCHLGRDCDTILFRARFSRKEWQAEPPDPQVFADWNRAKLFGRAWLDDEDRAVLDHPVALGPGIPEPALRAAFERWRAALAEYAGHLGLR
ncbi:MAG TPA: YbjN domain-containing protein [Paracoccaceae bacterium]|nr:YbjN domain-containing protein [Paracoccaceae bacterium]